MGSLYVLLLLILIPQIAIAAFLVVAQAKYRAASDERGDRELWRTLKKIARRAFIISLIPLLPLTIFLLLLIIPSLT